MVDISGGNENIEVLSTREIASLLRNKNFTYSVFNTEGPGCPQDPDLICFEGCQCAAACCRPSDCCCNLANYENHCLKIRDLKSRHPPIYECNTSCKCGAECCNRLVQRGVNCKLEICNTGNKGFGVRTIEKLPQHAFVCEYAGEILGQEEAVKRTSSQEKDDMNYVIAVREYQQGSSPNSCESVLMSTTYVDPQKVGNVGRFINHSCEPNLLMIPVRVDSVVPHLALFASRDIEVGEELTFDYGGHVDHPDALQNGNADIVKSERKSCKCGAVGCRGFLPFDCSSFDQL